MKPKKFLFRLFRCFEPISKQPKQTELFQNEPKQSGIFLKIPKYALFQNLAEQEQEEKMSQNTLYHSVAGLKVPIAEQINSF